MGLFYAGPFYVTLCHQKSPRNYPPATYRPNMANFKLYLYFPGWVGGWLGVVIIKLKANLSSNWTGLGLDLD